MGSGKTTLGRAVAQRASIAFVDLDEWIEEHEGLTVKQIFAAHGEAGFRERERDALRAVSEEAARSGRPALIACGGGTPCFFDNMEYMNRSGVTVLLDPGIESFVRRLSAMRANRPLIADLDDSELRGFIVANLERRTPFYSRAAHTFVSDRLETVEEVADSVDKFITRFLTY